MQVRDMIHSFVFEYSLESFIEKRQLTWHYEPYLEISDDTGAASSHEGPIPKNAWSIELPELKVLDRMILEKSERRPSSVSPSAEGPKPFCYYHLTKPVPGTISINSCHICCGSGRRKCQNCFGTGSKSCQNCAGHGFYGYKSTIGRSIDSADFCFRCHGRGTIKCLSCSGDGMISCNSCAGTGQIKCYIMLIVIL